jgi:putative DNA methylase
MPQTVKTRKKLIEVALPLEAINIASAREKSIRHGHPSTLHLWWARRPLAAARAVIFSQMVDDPSGYADELLADPKKRKAATEELERRRKLWNEREALYEKAGREGQTTVLAPGPEPTLEESAADLERERLFVIIRQLVLWENTTNETVLTAAREEIWKSWRRTCADNKEHPRAKELFNPDKLPAFHDPFAGGGALPLEAQRLGLEAYASDLNPVAVLINKAMIEIPPKFAGREPVNPASQRQKKQMGKRWSGAQGLAEDVRYYGKWMRDEAEKRIGHLYPKVEITAEMAKERPDLKQYVGKKLTVIAWLWVRTVKSPNPAFADVDVPLASTFMLSTKAGREFYVEPVIDSGTYSFTVKAGTPKDTEGAKNGTKLARGANFRCIMSGTPIAGDFIKAEGKAGRMGARLMAIVAEGERGRLYLPPTSEMEATALKAEPNWKPDTPLPDDPRNFWTVQYGLTTFGDLFTPRQLVALTTFSDLVGEVQTKIRREGVTANLADDGRHLRDGGFGATAYAEAVAVFLACAVSKMTNIGSSIASWMSDRGAFRETFARQAIPMAWDFAEANTFADIGGSFAIAIEKGAMAIDFLPACAASIAVQASATSQSVGTDKLISTDPPYYDNIAYADLSDFFYVWLRRSMKSIFPDLFATLAVPKAEELVATPYRHGTKEKAEAFFLDGMTQAMHRLAEQSHPAFPVTIYYAFKQAETGSEEGTSSTGWETFLDAVIRAGFALGGTWPMRTEGSGRIIALGTNALASSIVIVCYKRGENAPTATRREFLTSLKSDLPIALAHLQRSNIAPVDLAQAAIGPGMAVYTRYGNVLDASGKPLSVRDALALINQTLDETLAEQEGDFDADTRWALAWFDHTGFAEGEFGIAETLSKAKNTSIGGLEDANILVSKAGKVRLLKPSELLPANWDPSRDNRLTVWEMVHHLIRVLEATGESGAAELFRKLGAKVETARELPYRLYTICERKKRAQEALSYNALVQSWPEIARIAREGEAVKPVAEQTRLDYQE